MPINTASISATDALCVLQNGWAAQAAGMMRATYMLHARAGVGKTQIVHQFANSIGAEVFNLHLTATDPRLHCDPLSDQNRQTTRCFGLEDLPNDPRFPAVLFLDDLTAEDQCLQSTLRPLLQQRRFKSFRLPDSVFVVAAGNTVDDEGSAHKLEAGLSERMIHLHIVADAADWLAGFAVDQTIHPSVVAFLKTRPERLTTTDETLTNGYSIVSTPRSWERVSQILRSVADRRVRNIMISGTLGEAIAAEFTPFADEIADTVRIDEILTASPAARLRLYPDTMHGLTALVYDIVGGLDAATAPRRIEIMGEILHLARLRSEAAFTRLPLKALCTDGFAALTRKGRDAGLSAIILNAPAYKAFSQERRVQGPD